MQLLQHLLSAQLRWRQAPWGSGAEAEAQAKAEVILPGEEEATLAGGGRFAGGFGGNHFGRGFRGGFGGRYGFGGAVPYYGYGYASCYVLTPYGYAWICN